MGQRGLKIVPEDVWSRASYVLAVKMLDPQFKGQVKNELISRDGVKLMAQMVRDPFDLWLNRHVDEGKRIAEPIKGKRADTMREMREDVQSSISYGGGTRLTDLRKVNYVVLGGENAGEHLLM